MDLFANFPTLGGDSLTSQFVLTVRKRLDVQSPVRAIFATPTVREIAGPIEVTRGVAALDEIPVGERVTGSFFTHGVDPLLTSQFVVNVRKRQDIQCPMRAIFETPTPREIAGPIEVTRGVAALDEISVSERVSGSLFTLGGDSLASQFVVNVRKQPDTQSPIRAISETPPVREIAGPIEVTRGVSALDEIPLGERVTGLI